MSQFSQYETPYYDEMDGGPKKTSGLAIASLVCSLVCCIPGLPLLGVLLGAGAMASIASKPARTGKGIAMAGIILGIVLTLGQVWLGYQMARAWSLMRDAPYQAIQPGFQGDYASMRANFGTAGMNASDEEAEAFITELRSRYGELQSSTMTWDLFLQTLQTQQPQPGQTEMTLSWSLIFDREEVTADLSFSRDDQGSGDALIFRSMTIRDSQRGDLTFPAQPPPPPDPAAP